MNRKSIALFSCVMLMVAEIAAQTISTDKKVYNYGENVNVSYSQVLTNGNIYFYQNASLLQSFFYKERITFSEDELITPVLEPGLWTVNCEYEDQVYATAQFRIADIPQADEDLKILLVTDIHVMAQDLIVNAGEAFDNAMNSNRKMLAESQGIYNQIVDSVIKFKPDLLLIPGDLTKDGEKLSHEVVVAGLKKVENAGIPCLVIPGNHDYNNPNSVEYDGAQNKYSETISEQDFARMYADFGYGGESVLDTSSLSYYTDQFPKLRIIGVDATRNRENTLKEWGAESNKSYGGGRFRPNTLQWVLDRADEADTLGRMVIVMMHHQLLQHFLNQDKVFSSASVDSGDSIAQVFIDHKIRTILTGHMHINNISKYYNTEKTDSLVEISTGSTIEYPACWRWITLNSDRTQLDVNTRYINVIKETDDLLTYGRDMLAGHTDILWGPISNMMWSGMRTVRNGNLGANPPMSTFLDILLNNKEGYSNLAYSYMEEPIKLIMLTASEANENLKYNQLVIDMMGDRLLAFAQEVMNNNDFSDMNKIILRGVLQSMSKSMFSDYLGSLLTDCSYCGTNNENTTNDLYVSLSLPEPEEIIKDEPIDALDNIVEEDSNGVYYDVLGRRYNTRPNMRGVYLYNGKKIYIQ